MSPFCRFIIFILVSAYSFVLKTSSTEISYEINKPNGAITVLIKGGDNLHYVKDYEWILRIDDDCHIISNVRKIFPPPTSTYLSSTRWIELDKVNFDTISSSKEGVVVKGLKQFARIFASQNDIFFPDETWQAPYTNLMFIRISWLKSQTLILKFIDEVAASKCIYSNRWGDLPLWGTALRLTDVPSQYLHIPYEHGSHHMTVLQDGRIMVSIKAMLNTPTHKIK
eukprot:gene12328-25936_t